MAKVNDTRVTNDLLFGRFQCFVIGIGIIEMAPINRLVRDIASLGQSVLSIKTITLLAHQSFFPVKNVDKVK